MFSKKAAAAAAAPPGVYRDDVDRDDAASTSSAVLLEDVDALPDEELPPYEDNPSEPFASGSDAPGPSAYEDPFRRQIPLPPELPFSTHDLGKNEYRTRFPLYSTDGESLANAIKHQASYPPRYYVKVDGSHKETRRRNNKETKETVQDFNFHIDISHLLVPPQHVPGSTTSEIEILPENKRGYRGTVFPSLNPAIGDVEAGDDLKAWCEKYVADRAGVKSFTLKREILNHDIKKVEQLISVAIRSTKYHGHLNVSFPTSHDRVIVYSPGLINQWRSTVWIRWVFYLTFLWIFAWPFLIFMTSRYEIIKSVWKYADLAAGVDDMHRKPTVMGEVAWCKAWQSTIQRAALSKLSCEGPLDEDYRLETLAADRRGEQTAQNPRNDIPRTGNAIADGAFSLLGQGLRAVERHNEARGWGRDC